VRKEELILLGKIIKIHGYKGALMIGLEEHFSEKINELEPVFVEVDGKPVPFFLEWIEYSGKEMFQVKFDDYNSRERVLEYVGCKVFIKGKYKRTENKSDLPVMLVSYTLVDKENTPLGKINKVLSYPMQVMLVINNERGEEVLIPYNINWVLENNKNKKILRMDLPEGIAEINRK